ncbi:MAG: hypothetical protein ACXWMS_11190 [Syntrophales bacterium]
MKRLFIYFVATIFLFTASTFLSPVNAQQDTGQKVEQNKSKKNSKKSTKDKKSKKNKKTKKSKQTKKSSKKNGSQEEL